MPREIFQFEQKPTCPECGKELDDAPAKDFIVFLPGGKPSPQESYDRCGWCDVHLTFQFKAPDKVEITS